MAQNELQLLPCPFCGKPPGMRRYSVGTQNTKFLETWAIECYCGMARTKGFDTVFKRDPDTGEFIFEKDGREDAIKAWNRRANHDTD